MYSFFTIILGDYRQRTRSYSFLITLAISLYIAYTFVPPPDAPYTTMRVGTYVGTYSSAWVGYITAAMTSVFLSLIGFFLVTNSVRKDVETEVGMIIATTQVSNFRYLLSKMMSNFLVLFTIVVVVFLVSIGVFFFRSSGEAFHLASFLLPYLFVTVPAMVFISALAITAEVLLGRKAVLQYIGFFVLFNILMGTIQTSRGSDFITWFDPFGVKVVTRGLEEYVANNLNGEGTVTSMGFIFGSKEKLNYFEFTGFAWPLSFVLSRFAWILFSIGLVYSGAFIFHRFDVKEKMKSTGKPKVIGTPMPSSAPALSLASLPPITIDYSIGTFIKTELLLLVRKGSRWLWLLNIGMMIALTFAPLEIAHEFLLPILWFLQVNRLSDLTTKEKFHRVHHFTFAAYQPLKRLLPGQLLSGVLLLLAVATPLLVRQVVALHFLSVAGIVAGSVFLVLLAAGLGIASGGKKLFEVLFFLLTYANVNRVPFADYFGFHASALSVSIVLTLCTLLLAISFAVRSYEIRHA